MTGTMVLFTLQQKLMKAIQDEVATGPFSSKGGAMCFLFYPKRGEALEYLTDGHTELVRTLGAQAAMMRDEEGEYLLMTAPIGAGCNRQGHHIRRITALANDQAHRDSMAAFDIKNSLGTHDAVQNFDWMRIYVATCFDEGFEGGSGVYDFCTPAVQPVLQKFARSLFRAKDDQYLLSIPELDGK
ncbi:hypothetical protein FWC63_01175 [Candidatus Saccharibacteria bacterium]|nr:hypothetical protein [Candidatus Saccharibacteria bacterium]